jgi:hypothetical protein
MKVGQAAPTGVSANPTDDSSGAKLYAKTTLEVETKSKRPRERAAFTFHQWCRRGPIAINYLLSLTQEIERCTLLKYRVLH